MHTYTRNFIDIMRYKDKVLIYQEKLWSCLTTLYTTSDRFHNEIGVFLWYTGSQARLLFHTLRIQDF